MSKTILKTWGLTLSLLLILALVACQSTTSQPQQTPEPTPEQGEQQEAQTPTPEVVDVILATTTSTQDSGLLDVLLPLFEEQTGYNVKTIAVGTGQALAMGEKGEADVLLVHSPKAEEELVEKGFAVNRKRVMYNDFIIIGPEADPAGITGMGVKEGFQKLAETNSTFVSRGDDSGTHKKELAIWEDAGIELGGDWYVETGQGMGATLQVAYDKEGYTLTDRGTYLAMKSNFPEFKILIEGDASLLNIYHVMQVTPEKFEMINAAGAEAFVEFMVAPETQEVIGNFGVEEFGDPLFFPDAE